MQKTESKRRESAGPVFIDGQADLLTEWMSTGLISKSQFDTFTRSTNSGREEGVSRG